jgi:ethanolamine utilization cobalamin adenosyltransferase
MDICFGGENKLMIITEIELRNLYRKHPFDSFQVEKSARLTPAATEFLNERKIKILNDEGQAALGSQHRRFLQSQSREMEDGGISPKKEPFIKPEEFTHLRGNQLVPKTHDRIKFRGKLDSIQAYLICLIIEMEKSEDNLLSQDLTELLEYLRKMMRADVMEEPLGFFNYKGWSDGEIRERSHHPNKYYGIKHFTPDPSLGSAMAGLNLLRVQVRELEIAALDAFLDPETNTSSRRDITLALNRLSSLVYIMMCQYLGGIY